MIYLPENAKNLVEALNAYDFPETLVGATRYGSGHINDTYCVLCQPREGDCKRFILQRMSSAAFPHLDQVMANFEGITEYLGEQIKKAGGDVSRETLSLVHTKDGKPYYIDSEGELWRVTPFIEETVCYQKATAEQFEASAEAFGKFQALLKDYPAETLYETIPHFHDSEDRYAKFEAALAADKVGRAASVQAEIDFVRSRKADFSVACQALRDGKLPLRVTHNDTKLNNVLFDKRTGEGICVIDLDTTMPGLSINDFGDSIRFGANHSAEDEKDLSKVNFDIELFEAYTRGFLRGAGGGLTQAELEYMPWGARLMTLECGTRFLTDYLDGDNYFHTAYPEHNLDRCRTQFKLVQDMEQQFDQMAAVIAKYAK